jgi:hypothetical protein
MPDCRCNLMAPADQQMLCAECATHRVRLCDHCHHPLWWADSIQQQRPDGAVEEVCALCVQQGRLGIDP